MPDIEKKDGRNLAPINNEKEKDMWNKIKLSMMMSLIIISITACMMPLHNKGGKEVHISFETIDSRVMMHNEAVISIMQIATVQMTGTRSWYYFGSTFDLETGELIPINEMIKINANTLRDMIVTTLSENEKILKSL